MFGRFRRRSDEVERMRRVVNLIPEYVDALIDERHGALAMAEGLDGRERHWPALRKLEKVERHIASILDGNSKLETGNLKRGLTSVEEASTGLTSVEEASTGLTGAEQRSAFVNGLQTEGREGREGRMG